MSMLAFPEVIHAAMPRARRQPKGGRPPVEKRPLVQQFHCAVATARLIEKKSYREICEQFGCSERAARKWAKEAPCYPNAPVHLRRFARS